MGRWKINAKFSSFLLRRNRRKEIDVFRFFPSSLSRACHIPEPYDRGWVYARTSNQSGTGYRRLYKNRHQHWSRSFVPCVEDVPPPLPSCGHEFRLYIRGLLHRRRLPAMPGQRCFSRVTSNESIRGSSVRPSQVRTWHGFTVSSSLSSHEGMLKFDRIPILLIPIVAFLSKLQTPNSVNTYLIRKYRCWKYRVSKCQSKTKSKYYMDWFYWII